VKEHAEELLRRLEKSREWPLRGERKILKDLYLYAALREADSDYLKPEGWKDGRQYIVDPLGQRIPEVWADMIFGEDPDFSHADQTNLDELVSDNDVPSELQSASAMVSSEGEAWWRVYVDKDLMDRPILDWHSRTTVVPHFKGRRLVAVAFISVIQDGNTAWRYVEVHAETVVVNRLYKLPASQPAADETDRPNVTQHTAPGKAFGEEVPLTDREETADIEPEWNHGLATLLCGRVINKKGRTHKLGVSDFRGVKDMLLALNEAATIGHENMRLTAKKRVEVDATVLAPTTIATPNGNQLTLAAPEFDAAESVFVRDNLDETLGSDSSTPFRVLEYSFDAAALTAWYLHLEDLILTRTRVAPQLVGRHTEQAQSAPALRARLIDSHLAANGKGRFWDDEMPNSFRALMLVDQLSTEQGGFGRPYTKIDEAVMIKRTDPIPEDEETKTRTDSQQISGGLASRKTVIKRRNPDWDDARIEQEIADIERDQFGPPAEEPA
jgi:hypothetical protein